MANSAGEFRITQSKVGRMWSFAATGPGIKTPVRNVTPWPAHAILEDGMRQCLSQSQITMATAVVIIDSGGKVHRGHTIGDLVAGRVTLTDFEPKD
jgi:hypothetical protein